MIVQHTDVAAFVPVRQIRPTDDPAMAQTHQLQAWIKIVQLAAKKVEDFVVILSLGCERTYGSFSNLSPLILSPYVRCYVPGQQSQHPTHQISILTYN
jgi:hypothetical protein